MQQVGSSLLPTRPAGRRLEGETVSASIGPIRSILWADVTFQPGISDTDSQAVTYPGGTWGLHHPDLYFYWVSSSVDVTVLHHLG